MSYRYLVEPDGPLHQCILPSYHGEGTSREYLTPNTVVECSICGKRWVWAYSSGSDDGYSDGWSWERLSTWRPKHREARRLLRQRADW